MVIKISFTWEEGQKQEQQNYAKKTINTDFNRENEKKNLFYKKIKIKKIVSNFGIGLNIYGMNYIVSK